MGINGQVRGEFPGHAADLPFIDQFIQGTVGNPMEEAFLKKDFGLLCIIGLITVWEEFV